MDEELDLGATVDQIGNALFGEGGELEQPDPLGEKRESPPTAPKPEGEDAAVVEGKAAAPATPTPPAPPAPDDPLAKPPKTWKAEEAAGWETLTPAHRAAIHRREEDFFKGIEVYKQRAERGDAFERALAPFQSALRHYGVDPTQLLPALMNAQMTLTLGRPEEKVALVRQLIRDYKIDVTQLGASPSDAPPFVDPQVQALQARLDGLESTQRNAIQAAEAAQRQKLTDEITAFANDPANVYFNDVSDDMAALIRGSGGTMKLKDAYERAVWANPATRLKEQERLTAEREASAKKAAAEAAAKAKADSAANVKTSHKRVAPTGSAGSMDDTLAETLKTIRSRG